MKNVKITEKELKNFKEYKIASFILFGCLLIIFFFLLFSTNMSRKGFDVKYKNISDSEISGIEKDIADLKPLYLSAVGTLEIVRYQQDLNCPACEIMKNCGGCKWLNTAYVLYNADNGVLRNRICHELGHSFSSNEDFVYDLADNNLCYKNPERMEITLN